MKSTATATSGPPPRRTADANAAAEAPCDNFLRIADCWPSKTHAEHEEQARAVRTSDRYIWCFMLCILVLVGEYASSISAGNEVTCVSLLLCGWKFPDHVFPVGALHPGHRKSSSIELTTQTQSTKDPIKTNNPKSIMTQPKP